jgi:DNA ligase-1
MVRIILLFIVLSLTIAESKPIVIQKPKIFKEQNVTGWMMSEKLDGIRGVWDGKHLYTKNGNLIHAPKYFTKEFPPFALDGEIWSKREDFENIQSIVLDKMPSKKWKTLTYNVFEAQTQKGDFLQRLSIVKKFESKYLKLIKQIKCKSKEELDKYLKEIELKGGEGVIVKNPVLDYFSGRSSQILKVKSFKDMEAKIIGYKSGKGKYKNMLGSFKVKLKNGVIFNLGGGLSEKIRKNPPPLGSIVTFKYYSLTKQGKPKFASFMRVREVE